MNDLTSLLGTGGKNKLVTSHKKQALYSLYFV